MASRSCNRLIGGASRFTVADGSTYMSYHHMTYHHMSHHPRKRGLVHVVQCDADSAWLCCEEVFIGNTVSMDRFVARNLSVDILQTRQLLLASAEGEDLSASNGLVVPFSPDSTEARAAAKMLGTQPALLDVLRKG